MSEWQIRLMDLADVGSVVQLQAAAFPPPFPAEYHWRKDHILRHLELYAEGQMVAVSNGQIVGSCSNTRLSEERWLAHRNWFDTVGGPCLDFFDANGSTLYGLDITVHPIYRRQGIARGFYNFRKALVRARGLARYGTGCRIPDFAPHSQTRVEEYVSAVASGALVDRTLTPLLKMGLTVIDVIPNYMEDRESRNFGVLLEWNP